ncbi:MAG: cystathionine gamma-synthase [Hyphomicrobiales bacterium]|nr:MAG: cystathionine gamma-synthase [Hyphomicrobiales bacterium]
MTIKGHNRPVGTRTLAIHGGEVPDPATGASAPNIAMSTTYVVDEVAGFSAHDLTPDSPYLYTRWGNPTVRQLEAKLAALEGAEGCVAFASGMAAASALFFSLLSAGDHVVISDVSYAGVAELVRETLPRFGIEVTPVDMSDLAAVSAAIRPTTKLVYAETPANPILRLTDLSALAEVARAGGAKLAVDSTFATPIATRPIELGCDYVVHSLTKYLGGHGDALGGAVLGNADAMQALNVEAGIHYGGIISPFNAWLIMRGMATLPLRMRAHAETALKVAEYLEAHPKVSRVIYPGLPSHPQHDLAKRQMANFSGMLTFQVGDGASLAEVMIEELEIIHYAVSLGHQRSLIFWMPTDGLIETSFHLEGAAAESYRAFAGDGMFRFSVGLEDADDLIADLDRVLAKA